MSKVNAFALLVTTFPLALACGASKPEPTASTSPPADVPSASIDAASPTSPEPPPAASATGPAATSTAEAPPAPSAKPGVVIGETKDECTPVGVDFEKRARPKLKECYAAGKKKDPSLEGTVKIKVTVDVKGKIKSTKIIEKTMPDPVADCMLKVIKTTPFPEVDKCWDATLTIPVTFPTPK
ncbi:MAG TPA: AgmX/PglI C-terminal domain-containing protein [Labilithrix sp.]|nr:AgmX/PglI C-terminal domain-containing protein [Labilithrix sp.]